MYFRNQWFSLAVLQFQLQQLVLHYRSSTPTLLLNHVHREKCVMLDALICESMCLCFCCDFCSREAETETPTNEFLMSCENMSVWCLSGHQPDHQEGAADHGPRHRWWTAGLWNHSRAEARLPGEQAETREPHHYLHTRYRSLHSSRYPRILLFVQEQRAQLSQSVFTVLAFLLHNQSGQSPDGLKWTSTSKTSFLSHSRSSYSLNTDETNRQDGHQSAPQTINTSDC